MKLDENWSIENDTYAFKLVFQENRQRKNSKTGLKEDYIFVDSWWFPKLSMCLNKYLNEALKPQKTVEEIQQKLSSIESKIDRIVDNIFKPKK